MTLAELKAAYESGALGPDDRLTIDNDQCDVYNSATDEQVFEMHPSELLEQALTLLGIPWGHV